MTRLQSFDLTVKQLQREAIRRNMPEARLVPAEICFDLQNSEFTYSWGKTQCVAGLEKKFLADLSGFAKCKKTEATILVVIGEQTPEGCFIIGKHKNYWMKAV